MALLTCAGADVLTARVHMPERGPWWALLTVDTAAAPSGVVTLAAAGGMSLRGFVAVDGVAYDVAHVQLVGGAGGLGRQVGPAAWNNALLGDPLGAVLKTAGETLSSTVASSVTTVQLAGWSLPNQSTSAAIDALCAAASLQLKQAITWRVLTDGTIWLGAETWPAQQLPAGSDILDVLPAEGRYIIGAESPSLLPGVALANVGNVLAVDHWITHSEIRSWLWVS
jgi:hypothetical protein